MSSRAPPSGLLLDTRNFEKADPVDLHAGASFVETTRVISKKINGNHRILAKRAVFVLESWPYVEERVEKEKYSMYLMREEIKAFPRILKAVHSIQDSVKKIMERTVALEELLTGLEVNDLANRQDRWKRQQNSELREYQRKLQGRLNQFHFEMEHEIAQKRKEAQQLKTQTKQEEARSSLLRMKLGNVKKDVAEKMSYFESEEYQKLTQARQELQLEQKEKKVFEDAFQRDVQEFLKDPDYLKPKFPRSDEVIQEGDLVLSPNQELESFLDNTTPVEPVTGTVAPDENLNDGIVSSQEKAGKEESDDEDDLPKYEILKEEACPVSAEL